MNAGWYVHRLRQMSLREIAFRTRRSARHGMEFLWHMRPRVLGHLERCRGDEWGSPAWFLDLGPRQEVAQTVREAFGWSDVPARALLAHRFSFFAFRERDFGPVIRWNHEYAADRRTPLAFAPRIDYRDESVCGNIKYAWEHNRHHHLVELAKAAYLTGDPEFEREVVTQVGSWIEECPYLYGINWASALEVAIRLINWCFCIALLDAGAGEFEARHPGFRRRWIASCWEHLQFIERNLSAYSSANNHLIGEASGLFVGALCFRFPESGRLRDRARLILEREAARQTFPDGVNREQATGYQLFVFDFLMLPALLGRRNGVEFAPPYWAALERMAEFVAALEGADGTVPQIGDDDEGYVVRLSADDRSRSVLATAGIVFGRRDLIERAGGVHESAFWLTGASAPPPDVVEHAGHIPSNFPSGGYHILSTRRSRLIFDCGPLGYLTLAAHGHADALSVLVEIDGAHLFIDPGTYAYHTRRVWRDYFRGTAAHNTIRIDRRDQSEIGGPFMWMRHARCTLLHADASRVAGEHDGYDRLGVRHRREIRVLDTGEGYALIDTLTASGTHRVEQFFHCPSEWECGVAAGRVTFARGTLRAELGLDPALTDIESFRGSDAPRLGWWSPGFDRLAPALTVRCAGTIDGTTTLRTTLHVSPAEGTP